MADFRGVNAPSTTEAAFQDTYSANLVGLWDFQPDDPTADTGIDDGIAQTGQFQGGASSTNGVLTTDWYQERYVVTGGNDEAFQLSEGTLIAKFNQTSHLGTSPDAIVTRGEYLDRGTEGYFELRVTPDGKVEVQHADGADITISTTANFFTQGDDVEAFYSWSPTGGSLKVINHTQGTQQVVDTNVGLSFAIGDNDAESFMFAAREYTNEATPDQEFNGAISYVALYDGDVINSSAETRDGIVSGTADGNLIDVNYTGDPHGDMVDNNDAILGNAGSNDDIIDALDGNDTVLAGAENDVVYAGSGDDSVIGEAGNDLLLGDGEYANDGVVNVATDIGSDTMDGESQDDILIGDGQLGSDLIVNGSFEDVTGLGDASWGKWSHDGTLVGWNENSGARTELHNDVRAGREATDGEYWLDLDGLGDNLEVGQNVAGVEDGHYYLLRFDAGDTDTYDAGSAANGLNVVWNGEIIATIDPNAAMTEYQFVVTGGSGDGSNRLEFHGTGVEDNHGAAVDNVRLQQVLDDELLVSLDSDALSGHDSLIGSEGDDVLMGQVGNDTLDGGAGSDLMVGGTGNDIIKGVTQGDTIDGGEDPDGLDLDTLDLRGAAESVNPGGRLTVEYDPFDTESGVVRFFDAGGAQTGTSTFTNIENVVICFAQDTQIVTPKAHKLVQDLRPGDKVVTRDNGLQEIRWIGRRDLSQVDLLKSRHLRPVRIRAGALGRGMPERDLLLSPNHRVLFSNEIACLLFGEPEVLAAAKHLVGLPGVEVVDVPRVSYFHVLFDQHEVIQSDGAWTESFQPGDYSLNGLGAEQRGEIFELFPDLQTAPGLNAYQSARTVLNRHESRLLVA